MNRHGVTLTGVLFAIAMAGMIGVAATMAVTAPTPPPPPGAWSGGSVPDPGDEYNGRLMWFYDPATGAWTYLGP